MSQEACSNRPFSRFRFSLTNFHASPAPRVGCYKGRASNGLEKVQKMTDRLLGVTDVIGLIGCGRSTLYKWTGNPPESKGLHK